MLSRDGVARRAVPARARALPARLGQRCGGHRPDRPPGHRVGPLPGLGRRARRDHRDDPDPSAGAGRGVPAPPEALRAPVPAGGPPRRARPAPGVGRPQHRPLQPAAGGAPAMTENADLVPFRQAAWDEKPFAITLNVGSSLANKTGAWRTERPVYVDRMPPCNDACPAGENVQRWLYEAEDGGYQRAWQKIMLDNPFPAIMGRVCYHPCQTACNRATLDQEIGRAHV